MLSRALPLLLALPLLAVCGHKAGLAGQGANVVASSSVYLRNTFDTDPSIYVGRFIPAGVTELDESNAMVLACSKHITSRFIDGGGVDYSEDLKVSTQVALKVGLPTVASASGSYDAAQTARAKYKLTGKIVAEIADPEAFAACCKGQPDQCSDRFIGEFIQGTGALLHETARSTEVKADGTVAQAAGVNAEAGVGRSAEWQRIAEFPDPVYFAFKVNPTPYTQAAVNTCPSWVDNPPAAAGGVYVVGRSDNARSEQSARSGAMNNATMMAMRAAGISYGVMIPVRAESWCVTTSTARRGALRYSARVLTFVTDQALAEAKVEARQLAEREEAAERAAAAERDRPGRTTGPIAPTQGDPAPTQAAATDLQRILAAVQAESFGSDKLAALALSARGARLTAAEGRQILDLFSFSGEKLEALQQLRPIIQDPQNWEQLVNGFTHASDRDEARKLAP